MINGEMIAMPFIVFLFLALIYYENSLELFAALVGLIGFFSSIILTRYGLKYKTLFLEIVVFFMLLMPVLQRVLSVPIALFNYITFLLPLTLFVLLYVAFLSIYFFAERNSILSRK
jgi:hypothetical protein